ncbi:MAG: cyclic nucleotide-binding domain-containing protein [Rubrivivax sp.]|nr:MAG: cyclic nucleotide-binding domain-containing protein [Rubrivivax sp.]
MMTAAAAPNAQATPRPPVARHEVAERIADTLRLLHDHVAITRRIVHAGDSVYQAGEAFAQLHVINSGFFKTINLAADGREQVVGLHFKGDWLGFDGIAGGRHGCDAVALDTGEVWTVRYDALLGACARHAPLLGLLHAAMSREITRDRDSLLSLCTLSADARVAEFLRYWADAMAQRGLRHDQITLRMTRAEIGNYLGMTLETVSRALSRLSRDKLIAFPERGRRDVSIPDVQALGAYVQRSLAPASTTLQ